MLGGTWSYVGSVAPDPTSGSWGSGSGGGGTFSTLTPVAPSTVPQGTISFYSGEVAPAPTYSYQTYSYQGYAPGYSPAGYYGPYGIATRQLGEGGEYTSLDYPVLRFLHEGESLEKAALVKGPAQMSLKGPLVAAALLLLLLK